MIGDMLSNLATAQKLDISQIQKAIQDGTLPAYMGIPLLQQKLQQRQEATALLAGQKQQGQPPIAQQIMQEADQVAAPAPEGIEQALNNAQGQAMAEQQGIDTAPSNLPPQGFAGGGIVAFADGGLSDDEEDADKEDRALFSSLLGGLSMPKSYEAALAEKGYTPQSLRELVRKVRKDDLGNYVAPAEGIEAAAPVAGRKLAMKGHPYHEQTVMMAKKLGVDPEEALKLLYTETGGVKDPARAKSKAGAYGPLQLMEPTAREIGVNRKNPLENIRGGLEYYKQQRDVFGDPKLAAAAYNAGPGAVRRVLKSGAGLDALPMETRQYAANFNGGGVVALAGGGLSDLFSEFGPEATTMAETAEKRPLSKEAAEFLEKQAARKAAPSVAAEAPGLVSRLNKLIGGMVAPAAVYEGGKALGSATMGTMAGNPYFENYSDPFMGDVAVGNAILNQNQGALGLARQPNSSTSAPAAPTQSVADIVGSPMKGDQFQIDYSDMDKYKLGNKAAPEEAADQGLSDIRQMIKDNLAENKRQKEIDAWMSLLAGGIGTLRAAGDIQPGKVHTAFGDIGTGAQTGLGYYTQAAKQRGDENKALLSAQLGLSRAELYEKMRRDALKQRAEEKVAGNQLAQARFLESQKANMLKARKQYVEEGGPDKLAAKFAEKYGKNWSVDPKLQRQYEKIKQQEIAEMLIINSSEE